MEQVNKRVTLIFTVVTLVLVGGLVIYAFFIAGSGGVKARLQEGELRVQAMMCDVTCGLDEICLLYTSPCVGRVAALDL